MVQAASLGDLVHVRASLLRGLDGGPTHEGETGTPEHGALRPFDWLDAQAVACRAALVPALGPYASALRRCEIRVESRLRVLALSGVPPQVEREVALVVQLVLEGRTSLLPVLWQTAVSDAPLDDFLAALEGGFLEEVRASLEGTPLEAPLECPVVLEPWLASQLIHECIGHTSEADNFLAYARPQGHALGLTWTEFPLQVFDDPLQPGRRGGYAVDHDGAPARRTQLVRDGRWNALLHNRETRERMGEEQGGNGRRVPGVARTLPRMSVTYTAPGHTPVEELIAQVDEGFYCAGTWGGGSMGMNFILRPVYAQRIRAGRLTGEYHRRFDFRGDKRAVLAGLAGLGNALTFFDPAFGCDKDGQDGLPVSMGAPHMWLRAMPLVPFTSRSD